VAGDIDPYGNYNTEARYGISLVKERKTVVEFLLKTEA
jgi:hypothetical protein